MGDRRFTVLFIALLAIQLVLSGYCQIGPFIFISILPAMVLCFPTSRPSWWVLLASFLAGITIDGLSDGVLGLNAAAILPVAALQKPIIRIFIDSELVERNYNLSYKSNGFFRIALALLVCTLIYIVFYVLLDGFLTRDALFNFIRILCSISVSMPFALVTVSVLSPYSPTTVSRSGYGARKR